jgi:hypothetical protein
MATSVSSSPFTSPSTVRVAPKRPQGWPCSPWRTVSHCHLLHCRTKPVSGPTQTLPPYTHPQPAQVPAATHPGHGTHRHLAPSGLLVVMGGPNKDQVSVAISVHIHGAESSSKVRANLEGRAYSHLPVPPEASLLDQVPNFPSTRISPMEALHLLLHPWPYCSPS